MAFLGVNASLRTNESFRARNDDEYHKGNSPWNVCRLMLPRSLNDIEYWKANEFRTFLLFTGPIILKGRIKKQFFLHCIKLHCAIKILVTSVLCLTKNEIAYNLILDFVNEFKINYGAHFITHNSHSLIHLPYYVKIHGCLDNFSAFKYENYLGVIKKSILHVFLYKKPPIEY
ncbi:Uncharacterized protein FWK35_00011852 [Aphis craccivora]|uniref:DUF4218 domain-containing protein n=1 Tax=Aphis craccivora TaxID=307492 RepID=A0A6G0YJ40_APHCR|nr:Uncharacterized protein FWK35_00011852 [Aphis craccivora]